MVLGMDTPKADTSATIRAAMAAQKLSQAVLADRLGVTQAWLSRRLTGQVAWRVSEVAKVTAELGGPHEDREPVSTELWNERTC